MCIPKTPLIEVLDGQDQPCLPGQTGRVVLTALHNFLSPFIRYELLDEATLAPGPCPCGRGLPLLTRVLGRRHPLFHLPGGRRKIVTSLYQEVRRTGGCHQFQIIQRDVEHVVVRVVPDQSWTVEHPERLRKVIWDFFEALSAWMSRRATEWSFPRQASCASASTKLRRDEQMPRYPWNDIADYWQDWGPPLRPCAEDLGIVQAALATWLHKPAGGPLQVLMCGVTPELADLAWPEASQLVAVDQSESMIEKVWPGDIAGRRRAMLGQWHALPVPDQSQDVILGDGLFVVLDHPQGQRDLVASVRRALRPGGLFIMRCFVLPEERETSAAVFQDLQAGRIGSFHVFKFRLAMALQPAGGRAVNLDEVWKVWDQAGVERAQLMARTGWSGGAIDTIGLYKGNDACLSFLTLAETRALLAEKLQIVAVHTPGYEMGERCPTLVCRRGP